MIKNEKVVVEELRAGNEQAFEIIYNEYYKLVNYVIFKIVNDVEITRQLTNDTFLIVYNKIEQHNVDKSLKYWILTIAKNTARQYLRNRKDANVVYDSEIVETAEDKNNNFNRLMLYCCSILDELEFDVLNYKIVYNFTFVEIGKELNISKSTAHRIYKKAIQKIKVEM